MATANNERNFDIWCIFSQFLTCISADWPLPPASAVLATATGSLIRRRYLVIIFGERNQLLIPGKPIVSDNNADFTIAHGKFGDQVFPASGTD